MTQQITTQYKSLYEYLGHAAGQALGAAVAAAATAQGVQAKSQQICNPKYSGLVLVYPVSFLDNYFNPQTRPTVQEILDQDLPF